MSGSDANASKTGVTSYTLGPFATNGYILTEPAAPGRCVVIDAPFDSGRIVKYLQDNGLQPETLILTHAHVDHIAGVTAFKAAYPGLPVWIHQAEADWLNDPLLNLSGLSGQSITAPAADRLLTGDEHVQLLGRDWQVVHTPGHSPGGITLYEADRARAFVGDALFAGSIGRTDFPGSDHATLMRSIKERLYTLPPETVIYPGHGPATTIARERISNPFVRG